MGGSFGVWLALEILAYAKYAAVSRPATNFKIALAIQLQKNMRLQNVASIFFAHTSKKTTPKKASLQLVICSIAVSHKVGKYGLRGLYINVFGLHLPRIDKKKRE